MSETQRKVLDATGALFGAAASIGMLAGQGFHPSAHEQAHVVACAQELPEEATYKTDFPPACETWRAHFDAGDLQGYYLPARADFLADESPGTLYDARMVWLDLAVGATLGGIARWSARRVIYRGSKNEANSSAEPGQPTLSQTTSKNPNIGKAAEPFVSSVRVYAYDRWAVLDDGLNGSVLDDMTKGHPPKPTAEGEA